MRGFPRLVLTVLAAAIVLAAAVPAAFAAYKDDADPGSQLVDVSKQANDMQKKIAELQAKGQVARAGKLQLEAQCGFGAATPVFGQWGDSALYALAPGGDLGDTSGWTTKNVTLSPDVDPYTGSASSFLFFKGDSQAVTPAMCVDLSNPTFRFFAKDTGGNGKSNIKVDVLYQDLNGKTQHLTVARIKAGSDWSPSIAVPIVANGLAAASEDGLTYVAFAFKLEGLQKNETVSLDGVYVDPFAWH